MKPPVISEEPFYMLFLGLKTGSHLHDFWIKQFKAICGYSNDALSGRSPVDPRDEQPY